MMKRTVLMLITVFLTGSIAMAQNAHCGDKSPEPKVRAEHMTDRMVKEYSLNDTQKKQLLEANLAFAEKMGGRCGKYHKSDMKKGGSCCESTSCDKSKADKDCKKANKMAKKEGEKCQLTAEQKAEAEKMRKEMEATRKAYDVKLQKIMTKDQYAAYSKKMQERKSKPKQGKRGCK